jgi:hypothetical protein
MSRTRRDSIARKRTTTVLELVKRTDGNYDLFLNGALHRGDIQEKWLPEELCVRLGFCGKEYAAILLEAMEAGSQRSRFDLDKNPSRVRDADHSTTMANK